MLTLPWWKRLTGQQKKFSIKDFFSKCHQIRSFLRIRSHLLKKFLMENFIFLCSDYCKEYSKFNTSLIVLNICICSIVFWENNKKRFCSGCEEYCFPKVVQVLIETIYFLKVFWWFQGEKKLICLNLFHIKHKIWRRSLIFFKEIYRRFCILFQEIKSNEIY